MKKNIRWERGTWHHTEQTKEKLRELAKRYPERGTKNLGKHAQKGATPWNKGKRGMYSEDYIKKLSESHKGKIPWIKGKHTGFVSSTAWKKGNVPWNIGKHHSKEALEKMSRTQFKRGQKPWNTGKTLSEEYRIKISASQKRNWEDIDFATRMFERFAIKPNKDELYLDAILQLNFPNKWKYVGDGQIFIDRKCPDFYNIDGKKLLIEYNGFTLTHTIEHDNAKAAHYARYGYKTLNLYPADLNNTIELIEKIRKFMNE